MSTPGIAFLIVAVLLTFVLPRSRMLLPLLLSAAYMPDGEVLQIASANFTIPRLLVTAGFIRVWARGEHLKDGMSAVDKALLAWGLVLILTSAFHSSDAWLFRAGLIWTEVGSYFLFRLSLQSLEDARLTFRFMCFALAPLGVLMLVEQLTAQNPFGVFMGVSPVAQIREGNVRATGSFAHPILAGTTGMVCIAMGLAVGKSSKPAAVVGCASGCLIVGAAMSSGPILAVGFLLLGLAAWPLRRRMRTVRWSMISLLLALAAAMEAPIYFLMARIDISGGSQGYYRAQLIHSALEHLSEWWLWGTDYTRHWMASGIHANTRHADITNHFLAMGVMGGLPLMLLFMAVVAFAFRDIGRFLQLSATAPSADQTFIWTSGALLFAMVFNFLSISLFDHSVIFFYLLLASISSAGRRQVEAGSMKPDPTAWAANARTSCAEG
jgi:hypothetical protein